MLSRKRLGGMLWDLNPTGILYLFNAAKGPGVWVHPAHSGAALGTPGHPTAPMGARGASRTPQPKHESNYCVSSSGVADMR